MGVRKDPRQKVVAINCTLRKQDLEAAAELGKYINANGEIEINISRGIRQAFVCVRIFAGALAALAEIKSHPKKAEEIVERYFRNQKSLAESLTE